MDRPENGIDRSVQRWAASGAMALTGPPDGPGLGPPQPLVPGLAALADRLALASGALGRAVVVDPLALLTERAAIGGLTRGGRTSCGGAARILRAADGWFALSLPRDDDISLVPAWLRLPGAVPADEVWGVVTAEAATRSVRELEDAATTLGLPIGVLPPGALSSGRSADAVVPADRATPWRATQVADGPAPAASGDIVVAELGSLWAGPLCGSLLCDAGARVVKVESTSRPDGARGGPAEFFDLLNAGKRSVAIDLSAPEGPEVLRALLGRVDVVVEASRPRALEQLGIDAADLLRSGRPRVWVSITAQGRNGDARNRVGFGDDTAVAGGLVAVHDDEPFFCADAVADPIAGLAAATAALEALGQGGTWMVDVAMSRAASVLAGPTIPVPDGVGARSPVARAPRGAGPALGAHTAEVLAELGVSQ